MWADGKSSQILWGDSPISIKKGEMNITNQEQAVKELLRYIGEDPEREELLDTPKRFIKS